jgi:hypothetical protein
MWIDLQFDIFGWKEKIYFAISQQNGKAESSVQFFILNSKLFKYVYLYFGEPNKIIDDQESLDGTSIFFPFVYDYHLRRKIIIESSNYSSSCTLLPWWWEWWFLFWIVPNQSPPLIL